MLVVDCWIEDKWFPGSLKDKSQLNNYFKFKTVYVLRLNRTKLNSILWVGAFGLGPVGYKQKPLLNNYYLYSFFRIICCFAEILRFFSSSSPGLPYDFMVDQLPNDF